MIKLGLTPKGNKWSDARLTAFDVDVAGLLVEWVVA